MGESANEEESEMIRYVLGLVTGLLICNWDSVWGQVMIWLEMLEV